MADFEDGTATIRWFVQAVASDAEFADECKAEAQLMIENFIGNDPTADPAIVNPYGVPEEIIARAVLEVGADLYYRKASRNGVVAFGGGDMPAPEPFRINRDPMQAAYPLLRQYLPAPGL